MAENSPEAEAKPDVNKKPRKTSLPIIIGMIVVAVAAFFGIRQMMYQSMLNEENAKAATPKKILTRSEFEDSMVREDEGDSGQEETDAGADDSE